MSRETSGSDDSRRRRPEGTPELDIGTDSPGTHDTVGRWSDLPDSVRRRDLQWASDIVDHIDVIAGYVDQGREAFDDPRQPWSDGIQMRLVKMGHAARALTPQFRRATRPRELSALLGMRHRVAHDDVAVDSDIVWETAVRHLPALRRALEHIVEAGGPHED